MPTTFDDQFWYIDPYSPPAVGTALNAVFLDITDQNDDNLVDMNGDDSVNGLDITSSYPGDTVTVMLSGGGTQTITGTTFYLENGDRVFTPTDGSLLPDGATFLSSTAVPFDGSTSTDAFGPRCFTAGTMIETARGDVPVETLVAGDTVLVESDGSFVSRRIRWCGRRHYDAAALSRNPKLRPVRIVAGALGHGLPRKDLLVSRQHRVLIRSRIAERMFGEPEVLVAAFRLTDLPGIFLDEDVQEVTYFHLLFDQHEIVKSDGVLSESLYTGPEALRSIDERAKAEIMSIFPQLADLDYHPRPVRVIPQLRRQRKLVERHIKNGIDVF